MFLSRILKKTDRNLSFTLSSYCCFSTKANVERNELKTVRKYFRSISGKELKQFKSNFVHNLFSSTVDKSLFEYPLVVKGEDLNVVLDHSRDIESFLNNHPESVITKNVLESLRELEAFGLSVPLEYGGAGYSETEIKFLTECFTINPTIARFVGYIENFGCKLLHAFGNEEQKKKYLPSLAEGKIFMTLAYLETDSVVNLRDLNGFALHNEIKNEYIITAEKKWVHFADVADLFLVLVNSPTFTNYETKCELKMFLVDKNNPGVTVFKPESVSARKANLFEVHFKNACVPLSNLCGDVNTNGLDVFKFSLMHNNITDSAVILCTIKKIIHSSLQFINENNFSNSANNFYHVIQENVATLSSLAYGLESALYLLTGRYDTYHNPDLFYESILVKALAIDYLHSAIKKYIDIAGRGSFKKGILEEALNTLHYYTVLEENIENLKLMVANEGLLTALPNIQKRILMLRMPYNYVFDKLKDLVFHSKEKNIRNYIAQHDFKKLLPRSLTLAAEKLESSCGKLQQAIEDIFTVFGRDALENIQTNIKYTEMAAHIYASIACLSRISFAIRNKTPNYKDEFLIAQCLSFISDAKIHQIYKEELVFRNLNEGYRKIGKLNFNYKGYPAEHPLKRTY